MHIVLKSLLAIGATALTGLAHAQAAMPVIPLTAGMYAIQAEVAATPRLLGVEDETVTLLGEKTLCDRYARAMGRRGIETDWSDGDAAARAGLIAIARLGGLI